MFIGNYGEAADSLKDVFEIYSLDIKELGKKSIEVTKINENYFNNGKDMLMYSSLLFEDFKQHCLYNDKLIGIIEFLKDSVDNNHDLCDYLEKCRFNVLKNIVNIKESKGLPKSNKYEILGEFYFDNYKFILTYSYYYFIQSVCNENEQYFYYGD
jgi:hypothetical protein